MSRTVLLRLPSGEPRRYLYDLLAAYPLRGGKALRPILCIAACCAFGGRIDDALPCAVALELLHTAFLVHDDIEDDSPARRGRSSLHADHGLPLALNAGDALAALGTGEVVRAVRPFGRNVASAVLDAWEVMIRETTEGQALDLGWQRDNVTDLTLDDYLSMAAKKTAWYTAIQPLRVGAAIGSKGRVPATRTMRFGWYLGLMFQAANDLSGGDDDLEEGKRTLLVVHLLGALDGDERRELVRLLGLRRPERGPAEIAWLRQRMDAAGSAAFARSCVSGLAAAATREADAAFGELRPSAWRNLLLAVVDWLLEESHYGDAS